MIITDKYNIFRVEGEFNREVKTKRGLLIGHLQVENGKYIKFKSLEGDVATGNSFEVHNAIIETINKGE